MNKPKQEGLGTDGTSVSEDGGPWLTFTVAGDPKPKERPRFSGHAYTPKTTSGFEAMVAVVAKAKMRSTLPVKCDVSVFVDFYRQTARRCDLDNLLKSLLDGANTIIWADDAQIVAVTASKQVDRARPRTEVAVYLVDVEAAA